jgi:hypothetical protein
MTTPIANNKLSFYSVEKQEEIARNYACLEGFPLEGYEFEDLLEMVNDGRKRTGKAPARREKRQIYLHPLAWDWLEIMAEKQKMSVTEYIERPFRRLGEPSLDLLAWIRERKLRKGLKRSEYLGSWDEPLKNDKA